MNPLDYTYPIDRLNYPGGDNGYAVPIGKCPKGTIFATFTTGQMIEPVPVSRMTAADSGTGWISVLSVEASGGVGEGGEWIAGHHPKLAVCARDVPTVPLFVDDGPGQTIPNARIELHEIVRYRPSASDPSQSVHTPEIFVELTDLRLGQRGRTRRDSPTATTNAGDSGVPRFVAMPDGTIAFLGQEITLGGVSSNWPVYLEMLNKIPDASWAEVRWGESAPPEPSPPEPPPAMECKWNGTREGEAKLYDGDINTKGLTFGDMVTRGVILWANPDTPESKGPIVQLAELRILEDRLELVVANDTKVCPWRNPISVAYEGEVWPNDGWPTEHGAVITLPFSESVPEPEPEPLTLEQRVKRLEDRVFGSDA